jgi:hypothetical protein
MYLDYPKISADVQRPSCSAYVTNVLVAEDRNIENENIVKYTQYNYNVSSTLFLI